MTTAEEVIHALGMTRHPEGGWYVETWRSDATDATGRSLASAVLFLLAAGEESRWHRVDAAELWQWSGGDALELRVASSGHGPVETHRLGQELLAGQTPQVVVPPGAWQAARSIGSWALVGCIVAPAFRFEGFELAPDGWQPGRERGSARG